MTNQSLFCVVCCDTFLSTVEVLLLIVDLFDPIVLKTLPVCWIRTQSRFLLFVNQYYVLFLMICFSQLLQFFLFFFTSLISLFLKHLQFDG